MGLFGDLRAHAHGRGIELERFPTQKTASLFAYLAYHPQRRHTREELATLLWPDAEPASARDRLTQALVWLRPRLEPAGVARGSVLATDRLSVRLEPAAVTTDVAEFESWLEAARRADSPAARRDALAAAVDLYAGDLLAGEYADWVLAERRRLLAACVAALRDLAGLYEQGGDLERAIETARRAVAADPLQEEAHQELIRLLAAAGRTAAALLQFRELQRLLAAEVGAEPSPATLELAEAIRHGQQQSPPPPPPSDTPAPPRPSAAPPPLPSPLTRIFGREAECEQIVRLVRSEGARLVTLIGVGGSGKTRLGLAAAAALSEAYRGAVAFVPLADLDDPRLVPDAIASALRLNGGGSPRPALEQVVEELSARPFLLLLDNAEHLAAGLAPVVRELLERAPLLTLLATSRQRFGLEGEREVAVGSLLLPAPGAAPEHVLDSPGVRLFADRARSVRPGFEITPDNAGAVVGICARLEGLPLAIELCAAWAQTLTPAQMLEKLDRRFDLLVSRRTDIPPRHRTLRAAMEYSYIQLPPRLQRLFVHLSVFRGGWSLEAAGAVCFESAPDPLALLDEVTELRERSLLLSEEVGSHNGGDGPQMRYRLLETLREYAGELLSYADRAALRRSHAAYFLALSERAEAAMQGPDQERSLVAVAQEMDNLRAALAWSVEAEEWETGLRLAGALGAHWAARGPLQEGERWLRRLLDSATERGAVVAPAVEAKAWAVFGRLTWFQGNYAAARVAHERALQIRRGLGDAAGVAESLYHLGITAYRQYDYAAARPFLEESLTLAEAQGDPGGVARVLLNLGNIALGEGAHDEARRFFRQSLELEERLGNRQRVANALNNLGLLATAVRDRAEADRLFTESLAISRALTDRHGTATALAGLGSSARVLGQPARARELLTEGLRLADDLGDRFLMIHLLLQLGMVEADASGGGDPAAGVFLVSAAHHLFERVVGSDRITEAEGYRETLDAARATLGDTAFDSAWSEGASAPLDTVLRRILGAETKKE